MRKSSNFMKKITIVVCSLMLSVICVFAGITIHQRMSGASGESGVLVHNTDKFAVIAQTGRNVKIGENVDIEELMEGNWDGTMLFAGWFVDQECTEAVTAETKIGNTSLYYAKYVLADALSIKLQLRENADETADMRVVSSVESLDYEAVGFEVHFYNDGKEDVVPFTTKVVQKRIKANTDGVTYNFSPKVIGANSEYFISGTIRNIAKSKRACDFYIRPYWVTLSGATVYGQGRYLSANDGLNVDNMNVPVRMTEEEAKGLQQVTINGKKVAAKLAYFESVAYSETGWAHLNVTADAIPVGTTSISDRTKLPSATKIQISDSITAIYQNYTDTGADTDTSWYDVDTTANQFVIATKADLMGFASIVNTQKDLFAGDTIILVGNVAVNEGKVADGMSGWTQWTPIGNIEDGTRFAGTFEADDNTISGIYLYNPTPNADNAVTLGFFGGTETGSSIQNLRMTESYFKNTHRSACKLGSIVADCHGNLDNVYSAATIYFEPPFENTNMSTGGLVGTLNAWDYKNNCAGTSNITNCWYSGTMTLGQKTRFAGGIAGVVTQGTVNMKNCLFEGTIYDNSTSFAIDYVGGFFGDIAESVYETTLNITSSISAGNIYETSEGDDLGAGVGAVGGYFSFGSKETGTSNSVYLNLDKVYATRDCFAKAVDTSSDEHTLLDADGNAITDTDGNEIIAKTVVNGMVNWSYNEDRFIGYCKEVVDESEGQAKGATTGAPLDFETDWSVRLDGVPIPQTMEDVVTTAKVVKDLSELDEEIALSSFGVTLQDATNMGSGNYVHTIENITLTQYETYLATLKENGFTKYASNTDVSTNEGCAVDGVYNTVYVKESGNWVLSITYVHKLETLYINISTGGEDSLSPHLIYTENDVNTQYEAVGKTNFVMSKITSGNQFIQRLPNGHFIVDDGGQPEDLEGLLKTLKKMAQEIGSLFVYVDAWHVSHQHSDHAGVFNNINTFMKDGKQELLSGIFVEGIYMSEPNNIIHSIEGMGTSATNQYLGMRWLRTSEGKQTPVYRYHTGQRYYFSGVSMDIVQSQEVLPVHELYPEVWDSEGQDNPVSTTVIYTLSSGEKIFLAADATHLNSDYIMKAYGTKTVGDKLSQLLHLGKSYMGITLIKNTLKTSYDEVVTGTNQGVTKSSKMLSDINVFIAPHHGANTTLPYANWLATAYGEKVDGTAKFDTILFPANRYRFTALETLASETDYNPEYQEAQNHANQWLITNLLEGGSVTINESTDTVTVTGKVYNYGNGSIVLEYEKIGTSGGEDKEEPEWSLPF